MSTFPDFSTLDFDAAPLPLAAPASPGTAWDTPEGIPVDAIYGTDALQGLDFTEGYPGVAPFLP